jgi:hypothetical protein
MPSIQGIPFDLTSHKLVSELVISLMTIGDFAVYGLPNTGRPHGQLRLAHHGPDLQHPKGRGVFAMIQPNATGATLIRRKNASGGARRAKLTAGNSEEALKNIISWREQIKDRPKGSEKVEPNKPGTVQGGQFESNRSKH